jgi:ferritin-like metal-binding protein YciE
MKTLHELFEDGLKDIYNAEKQLMKALPKMAKMAKNPRLKQGFENHLKETEAHAQRIEMACKSLGIKPSGMVCKGMKGLMDEATEHMSDLKSSASADAELIALAQKAEHYEIGTYGTLCTWAQLMGHTEALGLLKNNLSDEERTDQLLSQIAQSEVNNMAASESKQKKMGGNDSTTKRRTTTKRTTATRATPSRATGRRKTTTRATTRTSTTGSPGGSHSKTGGTRGKSTTTRSKTGTRSRASAR